MCVLNCLPVRLSSSCPEWELLCQHIFYWLLSLPCLCSPLPNKTLGSALKRIACSWILVWESESREPQVKTLSLPKWPSLLGIVNQGTLLALSWRFEHWLESHKDYFQRGRGSSEGLLINPFLMDSCSPSNTCLFWARSLSHFPQFYKLLCILSKNSFGDEIARIAF